MKGWQRCRVFDGRFLVDDFVVDHINAHSGLNTCIIIGLRDAFTSENPNVLRNGDHAADEITSLLGDDPIGFRDLFDQVPIFVEVESTPIVIDQAKGVFLDPFRRNKAGLVKLINGMEAAEIGGGVLPSVHLHRCIAMKTAFEFAHGQGG